MMDVKQEVRRMRLVEIDGHHINPDRVAFLKDASGAAGGKVQTRIHFSAENSNYVMVGFRVDHVVKMLTYEHQRQ